MRKLISYITLSYFLILSSFALAGSSHVSETGTGWIKVQWKVQKENSEGSFQLRTLLERHGYENNDGYVRTYHDLDPLLINSYLHEDGKLIFTILFPMVHHFFLFFDGEGFLAIEGVAAKKLFDIVKLHLPRRDIQNLEQYQWGKDSFCDKTKEEPPAYRCWIEK